MDCKGNPCNEEEAHGYKVHYRIIRPELCFYGDEVRGNISMKADGYNEGEMQWG